MRQKIIGFFTIWKNVMVGPAKFYRSISVTEGIRNAVYLVLAILYLRSIISFLISLRVGYFMSPSIRVTAYSTTYAVAFVALMPLLWLLIIYSQAIFINRIGNFFGGAGNVEGSFKVITYAMLISVFMLIPFIGVAFGIYAAVVLLIGVKEVFNIDWISSFLTVLFAYVFTAFLYIFLFGIPAFMAKLLAISI